MKRLFKILMFRQVFLQLSDFMDRRHRAAAAAAALGSCSLVGCRAVCEKRGARGFSCERAVQDE